MKSPQYVFRPFIQKPSHRKAWDILQSMPAEARKDFLVQAIIAMEQTDRLEESIRKVVREELRAVNIAAPVPSQPQKGAIPDAALDFLNSL